MNWRRLSVVLIILGLPTLGLDTTAAEPPESAATEIDRWVTDLDSDRFAARESATKKLIDAGTQAIGPIVAAMSDSRREVIERGVYVLGRLAGCGDIATEAAAQSALEGVAAGPNELAARRAVSLLEKLESARQHRAMTALSRLGAQFYTLPHPVRGLPGQRPYAIEIDQRWRGNEEHLVHVKSLVDIQRVVLSGPQVVDNWLASIKSLPRVTSVCIVHANVSDKGVSHLCEINSLRHLRVFYTPIGDDSVEYLQRLENAQSLAIYGSNITPDGTAVLRDKLVGTTVDVRNGAFLGVGAAQMGQPCEVTKVHPGGAAERAGIQLKDIITHYDGKEVQDFAGLKELIGNNRPGENVEVKFQRGAEQVTRRITLGEWDYRDLSR